MSGILTTPAEALKEGNMVQIALWNGKVFRAAIIDVLDEGQKLFISRVMKNGIPNRKEILTIGYGFRSIKTIAGVGCKHILKSVVSNDRILSYNMGEKKEIIYPEKYFYEKKESFEIKKPDPDFVLFLKSQEEFRKRRDLESKILDRKISEYYMKKESGRNNISLSSTGISKMGIV